MFKQAERLQETVLGRLFIVVFFPVLVLLGIVCLPIYLFVFVPLAMALGYLIHGDENRYVGKEW